MSTSAKFPKYRTPLHQAKGWGLSLIHISEPTRRS